MTKVYARLLSSEFYGSLPVVVNSDLRIDLFQRQEAWKIGKGLLNRDGLERLSSLGLDGFIIVELTLKFEEGPLRSIPVECPLEDFVELAKETRNFSDDEPLIEWVLELLEQAKLNRED